MTELVTAREIPSERPVARRLADARVRYVLLVGALAGAYYAAAQIGYSSSSPGRGGDRLAAGRRRDRVPLPRGPEAVAGRVVGDLLREPSTQCPGRLARLDRRSAIRWKCRRGLPDPQARAERASTRQRGRGLRPAGRYLAAAAVSATMGPCRCGSATSYRRRDLPHVWRTWWLGDTAGALVVVPLALAWGDPSTCPGQGRGSPKAR